jgi:hypothetical protein
VPTDYLTKVGFGRWWFYLDTKRKYKARSRNLLGWPLIVISYRKISEEDV